VGHRPGSSYKVSITDPLLYGDVTTFDENKFQGGLKQFTLTNIDLHYLYSKTLKRICSVFFLNKRFLKNGKDMFLKQ
jgi:hypothetical protein